MSRLQNSFNRIIGVLPLNNSVLTRTRNFLPDYSYTDNFIDTHSFDEIVILKIDSDTSREALNLHSKAISRLMENSALPLTLGGGISSVEDVSLRFQWGADRVMLGKNILGKKNSVKELISIYGAQAIISCINYDSSLISTNKDYLSEICETAREYQDLGVGEIMLTAVDRDGTLQGLDLFLPDYLWSRVDLPITLNGGLGNWMHIKSAFSMPGVSGVCTSNILHLTSSAIKSSKKSLLASGVRVRGEWNLSNHRLGSENGI
jgi:cyclase